MFGGVGDDEKDLLKDGILDKLPAVKPRETVIKVIELMNDMKLEPRSNIRIRTVKQFVGELMNFTGLQTWTINIKDKTLVEICAENVIKIINDEEGRNQSQRPISCIEINDINGSQTG
eukprot:gene8415-11382_t